ncbi:MAG: hypothetical protein ACREL7_03345 [Longimicrobiales bacterium]
MIAVESLTNDRLRAIAPVAVAFLLVFTGVLNLAIAILALPAWLADLLLAIRAGLALAVTRVFGLVQVVFRDGLRTALLLVFRAGPILPDSHAALLP